MEEFKRMILKVSDVENDVATIPSTNDHTDGSWLTTDIYEGELFLNVVNNILQTRTEAGIVTLYDGAGSSVNWGDILGTLSDQTDLQNALNEKINYSDYTPSHSLLVQQSGTGSPTSLSVGNETLVGRLSGAGSEITDLSLTEVKELLSYAEVNPSNTFLPMNTDGEFTDSPFYTLEAPAGFQGFGGIGTKSYMDVVLPAGGVPDYNDFGLEIKSYLAMTTDSSVSIGDYAQSTPFGGSGEFYWYTGQALTYDASGNPFELLPFGASGIIHNSGGYNLLNITNNFFKIDAKTGNSANVDGLLYNPNSGIVGFGAGLDANSRSSSESSIVWDFWMGDFKIKGSFGDDCFYSNIANGQTYMQSEISKLGLEAQAMYISDDLVLTASPTTSTKILNVRDASGNSYAIKLYVP